jgi:predicted nucleotidyltransferase
VDTTAAIDTLRKRLAASEDVLCAYLFGSTARGEAGARSDLDVAVLLTDEPPPTLEGLGSDLADDLTEVTGKPVDLVILNRAPADLVHRILRDGVLILERDAEARIRFEMTSRNEYFDLLPHLQRYRRHNQETAV